jgi:hypothetical protein
MNKEASIGVSGVEGGVEMKQKLWTHPGIRYEKMSQ